MIEDCVMTAVKAYQVQVSNHRISKFWIVSFLTSYFGLSWGIGETLIIWLKASENLKEKKNEELRQNTDLTEE